MAMIGSQRLQITTGSSHSGLSQLIEQAHSFTSKHLNGVNDETDRAKLLINEVVVNAVKHGNQFDEAKEVFLDIDVCDHRVDIRVEDEGAGFNPNGIPDPRTKDNLQREHGRGLFLIQSLADEVSFEQEGRRVCVAIHRT
jgi:serine/threonine-protein kinase RsbW